MVLHPNKIRALNLTYEIILPCCRPLSFEVKYCMHEKCGIVRKFALWFSDGAATAVHSTSQLGEELSEKNYSLPLEHSSKKTLYLLVTVNKFVLNF